MRDPVDARSTFVVGVVVVSVALQNVPLPGMWPVAPASSATPLIPRTIVNWFANGTSGRKRSQPVGDGEEIAARREIGRQPVSEVDADETLRRAGCGRKKRALTPPEER